ncbi:hypothetical protein BFX40_02705 [Mesorhizobium sp. SEMIA 3007]|nr:hypothetical protein BFX40_02705 [Mesorhizobium sp. SEMIA 3007]
MVISTTLAGCVSEENGYRQGQELLRGSPAMKRYAIDECYRHIRPTLAGHDAEWARNMAKSLNVRAGSNIARIWCTRAVNGIASGRVTSEDMRTLSPRFIRLMQGR